MSRVDFFRPGIWFKRGPVLHLCLLAGAVQWGVSVGRGVKLSWLASGSVELTAQTPDDAVPPKALWLKAVQQTLGDLFHGTKFVTALKDVVQIRVLVSDAVLAVTTLPWSTALFKPNSAETYAREGLSGAGFSVQSDDVIRLDDQPSGLPRLVVAYPAVLLSCLELFARRLGASDMTVLPVSVAAWYGGHRSGKRSHFSALALVDGDQVIFVHGEPAVRSNRCVIAQVDVRRTDGELNLAEALQTVWQRTVLRDPVLSLTERLEVLDLSARRLLSDEIKSPFRLLACASAPGTKGPSAGWIGSGPQGQVSHFSPVPPHPPTSLRDTARPAASPILTS